MVVWLGESGLPGTGPTWATRAARCPTNGVRRQPGGSCQAIVGSCQAIVRTLLGDVTSSAAHGGTIRRPVSS